MNATDLTNRVAGAMLGHAGDLRTLLDSQDAIKVTVKFLVDTGGKPTIKTISAKCGGGYCPSNPENKKDMTKEIILKTGVSPGAATLGSPPAPCTKDIFAKVPPG
ncbi:hypothetical protein H0O00_03120, partial [Candidatus Micrarchaeota archaeon]|nr:hypothetical protein [Candidatus Micrarchaeota archaeon]